MAFKPEVAPLTASASNDANNVFLNVILTFDKNKPQSLFDIKDIKTVLNILTSKEAALDYFNSVYHSDGAPLVKVSMCLHYCSDELYGLLGSGWFKEANGKLWSDDFKTYRNEVDFINGDLEMESMSITWESGTGAFIDFSIEVDGHSFDGTLYPGSMIDELYHSKNSGTHTLPADANQRITDHVEEAASDHIQGTTVY